MRSILVKWSRPCRPDPSDLEKKWFPNHRCRCRNLLFSHVRIFTVDVRFEGSSPPPQPVSGPPRPGPAPPAPVWVHPRLASRTSAELHLPLTLPPSTLSSLDLLGVRRLCRAHPAPPSHLLPLLPPRNCSASRNWKSAPAFTAGVGGGGGRAGRGGARRRRRRGGLCHNEGQDSRAKADSGVVGRAGPGFESWRRNSRAETELTRGIPKVVRVFCDDVSGLNFGGKTYRS